MTIYHLHLVFYRDIIERVYANLMDHHRPLGAPPHINRTLIAVPDLLQRFNLLNQRCLDHRYYRLQNQITRQVLQMAPTYL